MKSLRFLMLGGGPGQLPVIRRLKASGIRVVLQDRDLSCPGAALADELVHADTCNVECAEDAALRFAVDGVLTSGTDQPVYAAARSAQKRGCPSFLNPEQALVLTDKEWMKNTLAREGIAVPRYRIISAADSRSCLNGLKAPYVVKPVDSQGQRGVLKFSDEKLFEQYKKESLVWSRRGRLVVEEYCEKREVTVSGWVYHGETSIWAISDRVTRDFDAHIGVCLAHRYPSFYGSRHEQEIRRLTNRCVHALGIEEGPIYFQFFICDDGILVNETAARLGGAYEDRSLPAVCGIDPIQMLIYGVKSGTANPDEREFAVPVSAAAFAVPMPFCRPGIVAATGSPERIRALPGVTAFEYLLRPGTLVQPIRNSVQRAAYAVIHGNNTQNLNRIVRESFARMGYYDSKGCQMLGKTPGYALNPLVGVNNNAD